MGTQDAQRFCIGRALAYTLGIVRFNVLLLIAGGVLLLVDQGQDILVGLIEDMHAGDGAFRRGSLFFLAVFFWAFSIWLWARTLLDVDFGDAPDCPRWLPFWRAHVPRVLGLLAFAAVAWGLWRTGDIVTDTLRPTVTGLTLVTLLLGVVFYLLVLYRRPLARRLAARARSEPLQRSLYVDDLRAGAGLPVKKFRHVFAGMRGVFILLSALLGTLLFFWAWANPVQLGRNTDVIVLVLVWAGAWLPLGSFITYFGNRTGIPLLAILLGCAVVFSAWNDNHEIAHVQAEANAGRGALDIAARPDVTSVVDDWLGQQGDSGRAPMLVVATAGGGIRAAYWTATVLGKLHQQAEVRDIDFANRLFAVSGVSGGSVGAAVYRAVLGAQHQAGSALPCGAVLDCSQQVLSGNLLGPAAAALLYPDLAQRFWPRPVTSADRGRALERGWETAFTEATGTSLLGDSLVGLNQTTGRPWPALLLNATWVGNGRRLIASNLQLGTEAHDIGVDQLTELGRDLPLSTAAHNSARFPGVSPAGMWRDPSGTISGRLVDGGYFENFGADSARELLERIKAAQGDGFIDRIRPVVISISSDPTLGPDPAGLVRPDPVHWGYEARAILRGLFRTRNAHGAEAFSALRQWTGDHGGVFVHLRMCESSGRKLDPPLGWVLSRSAQARINDYLTPGGDTPCSADNADAMQQVLDALQR